MSRRRRDHGGGEQEATLTVPGEPPRAGIDPLHTLIDRYGDDNVVAVRPGADDG